MPVQARKRDLLCTFLYRAGTISIRPEAHSVYAGRDDFSLFCAWREVQPILWVLAGDIDQTHI